MSSRKYDHVSIYYDKTRKRYGTKVTLEKGMPRKSIYGKSKEEVVSKIRQLFYNYRNEQFIEKSGIPLIDLLKMNFERRDNAGRIGDAQYVRTTYILKHIENSNIGSKNIRDITEEDYQNFFNKLSKEYSNSSIEKYYNEINQALKYAKKKKIIEENLLEDIIKPKSNKNENKILPLSIEKQKILTDYLCNIQINNYKHKNALLIQLYMGLRIGEALALKKDDIDLENKTMHIQRTLTHNRKNEIILGTMPKTSTSNRILPIPDIIFDFIKEQLDISTNNRDDLLFVNDDKLVNHTCMNDQLKRRLLNLGIYEKGISTHSLRHTYATRCIESGMQPIVLSKLLGHSDIRITLNTYVKIFNEYQTKVIKEVENYYKDLDLTTNTNRLSKNQDIDFNDKKAKGAKIIQFPKRLRNEYY